jgi:hypothetical protein
MLIFLGIFSSGIAFAQASEYTKTQPKEEIDVKLFFVTSFDECSRNNWDALESYGFLTKDYLWKYNIDANTSIDCINEDALSFAVDSSVGAYDLVIIFPDFWNSIDYLAIKNKLGHYTWNGNDRTILTNAFAIGAESSTSVWTLSHELSHFALEWYGYPRTVSGDEVHRVQDDYNKCISTDPTGAYCRHLWDLVESVVTEDTSKGIGKKYHVMEPIRTERNALSTDQSVVIYAKPDTNKYQEGWSVFITGNIINYDKNSPVILRVLDPSGNIVLIDNPVVLNSNEFKTSFVASKSFMKQSGVYSVNVFHKDATYTTYFEYLIPTPSPKPSVKEGITDSIVVTNFRIVDEYGSRISSDEIRVSKGLHFVVDLTNHGSIEKSILVPIQITHSNEVVSLASIKGALSPGQSISPSLSWVPSKPGIHEATVFGWLDENSNTPAFSPKSLKFEVLPSLIVKEPAKPSPIVFLSTDKVEYHKGDKITIQGKVENYNPLEPVFLSFKDPNGSESFDPPYPLKLDNENRFNFHFSLIRGYEYMEGKYTVRVTHNDSYDERKITFANPETVEQTSKPEPACGPGTELVNGVCQVIRENISPRPPLVLNDSDNDGVVDEKDQCSKLKENWNGWQDEDGCPDTKPVQKEHTDKENDNTVYQIKDRSNKELGILSSDLEKVVNQLKEINPNNDESREKIDSAWDLVKTNEQKLDALKSKLDAGDRNLLEGKIDTAKSFYTFDKKFVEVFNNNLIEISKLTYEGKNLQKEFCFLFWCW